MDAVSPLDRMTVKEKLKAVEVLWDDLCRNEQQIPVANWQKQLRDKRERQIAAVRRSSKIGSRRRNESVRMEFAITRPERRHPRRARR